ncbi:unnamed protein product, partial [marine sediment metagenome]
MDPADCEPGRYLHSRRNGYWSPGGGPWGTPFIIPPKTYEVTGAVTPDANGTYEYTGE